MKKIMILATLAALLAACGGGDPEPRVSIYETAAGGPFLGSSGKTHVNELEPSRCRPARRSPSPSAVTSWRPPDRPG